VATNLAQERANRYAAAQKALGLTLGTASTANIGTKAGDVASATDPRFKGLPDAIPAGASLVVSTDPRLTDARQPLPHAASHDLGGTDPVDIVALGGVAAPPRAILDIDHGDLIWDIDNGQQVLAY
jgi:hypothetical protein